jgi:hypothetical protein
VTIKVLAMARTKANAESEVTSMLSAIVRELAKILVHTPSITDTEWRDEIADKYISRIRDAANNVKTPKRNSI